MLKAKALRAVGHEREAYATLSEAQTEAKTLGARRSLWQIVAMLAEIESAREDKTAAAAHWGEALKIIEFISAHMPEPDPRIDLRRSFLTLPEVQAVMTA